MPTTAVTQTVHVDLNTGKSIPVAFAHQNDTSRTITFKVFANGTPWDLSGYTVKFAYISPIVDGQYTVVAGSNMVSGEIESAQTGWVYFTPTTDYTGISGVGTLTMILTPTGQQQNLRPVNIKFVVQRSADGNDVVSGASDFPTTLEETVIDYLENDLGGFGVATVAETKSYLGIS